MKNSEKKETNYTPEERERYLRYLKSLDKTDTINDETDTEKYDLKKRKKQFIKFCGEKRSLRKVRPGRLRLLNENDEQYASIQCKSGDCPETKTERNELRLENENGESKNDDFEFNKPYNYKFSFRIPENFPLSPTRLVIGQWKFNKLENGNENKGPSPILAQRIQKIDGKYYLLITDSHRQQLGERIPFDEIKGKWVDMEYKVNFSDREDTESSVEIIANIEGKKINIFKGSYNIRDEKNEFKLNPDKPHTGYFKFGLYRDNYKLALKKAKNNHKKNIKNIKKDKNLSYDEKKAKIAQANIEKKNDIDEIEQAHRTENENPMEIHFKGFSMEKINTNTEEIKQSRIEQDAKVEELEKQLNDESQPQQPQQPQETQQPQQTQDKADKKKLEKDKGKAEKEEKKYVEYMVTNSNIEGILKYIGFKDKGILDKTLPLKTIDFLNYNTKKEIEELKPIKDISENSIFQVNSNETGIIQETKKEYNRIHEKLTSVKEKKDNTINKKLLHSINKLFKELQLLEKNNFVSKLYKKLRSDELINDIIHVKNEIKEQDMKEKLKKIEKHTRRIKQYERGEYINFPNGINFELMRGPSEEGNVKIGENEYYIKTHVETNKGDNKVKYIEYVDTLKKAREFLKKNNINVKYCRRCTRLANRKFIETYEEKRKISKGKDYEKTNRLKVLEQTEKAVIFEEIENDGKPPIRFIEEGSDLYDFATGEGKDLFHESVMWLDLDKL